MKNIVINNISTSYYITEEGKCYNEKTGKYLKGQINYKNGYLSYNITLPNKQKKRIYAHRAAAIAFIPNPSSLPQVNHLDGNKCNNAVWNLEWATAAQNSQHSLALGLKKFKPVYCFNKDKELVAIYPTIEEGSKALGISASLISQAVNKEVKCLCGNCYWSYDKNLGETVEYKNLGKAKEVYQYDLKGKYINKYPSTGAAARSLGLSNSSHIGECARGKIKQYKGFVWRYSEDIVLPSMKVED